MNLPCISTKVNGADEAIQHQSNGLLVAKKDVSELFHAMHRLTTDLKMRQQMSQEARASVIPKYQQTTVWQAHLTFYQNCLNDLQKA